MAFFTLKPGKSLTALKSSDNNSLIFSSDAKDAYKIEDLPYLYGSTDCCYCAGTMAMMKYNGLSENTVQGYWQDLKGKNYYEDNATFYRLLKKYELESKFRMVYFPHGTKEINFKDIFSANLTDYKKQVTLIRNQDEALPTLKKIISSGNPVMVMVEDRPQITSDEIQDDTFILVYGYDSKNVYFWTLPGVKSSWSTSEFISRWKLQENNFTFPVMPGRYTMVWLKE